MEYSRSLRERYRDVVFRTHMAILELVSIVEERRIAELWGLPEPAELSARCDALKGRLREAQQAAHDLRVAISAEQRSASLQGIAVPDFLPEEL